MAKGFASDALHPAKLGFDIKRIAFVARWDCAVVMRYVEESPAVCSYMKVSGAHRSNGCSTECKSGTPPDACWFATMQGKRLKLAVREPRLHASKAMKSAQLEDESVEQLRAELEERDERVAYCVRPWRHRGTWPTIPWTRVRYRTVHISASDTAFTQFTVWKTHCKWQFFWCVCGVPS